MLRIALPSNDRFLNSTISFLEKCGLTVDRESGRSYTAQINGVPDSVALFQRAIDITQKVSEGSVDLGIVGLDGYMEARLDASDTFILMDDLGYSRCELILAVPDSWIDVTSVFDLADLSVTMREEGQELRVATKYPRLTQQFLYSKDLNYFSLIGAAGAMEAAPMMGYADMISDIVQTGVTIRENRLKPISDGTILRSQAVLIGNKKTLTEEANRLESTRILLEMIESSRAANRFYRLNANIQGQSENDIAAAVTKRPETAGIQGPTIAPLHSKSTPKAKWYDVTIIVKKDDLMTAVDHLRAVGGSEIIATPVAYVFQNESISYQRLLNATQDTK